MMTSLRADNPMSPSPGANPSPPQPRALFSTIRRQSLILLAIFCIACSLLFLAAPHLGRTYHLAASMQAKVRTSDAIPELAQLPDSVIKPAAAASSRVSVSIKGSSQSPGLVTQSIELASTDSSRGAALDRLQEAAGQISLMLQERAGELVAAYRDNLHRSADDLVQKNQTLLHDITAFRLAHRGALPDDPTSTLAQFDKLASSLDEKQQRLQIVTQQIKRLEDYQKNSQANGGLPSAPPPPLPPAGEATNSPRPIRPENDPEVVELTAQLQLLNNQVDEQLNTMHRTEQHPYVVDLRNQQAALQKKLDAARQRAAAGKPPPAAAQALAGGHSGDSAAAQTVELQLQSLQAERDALDPEVRSLIAQRNGMQKQVDEVLPIRQQYETLNAQLAAVRKDQEAQQARTEEFNRQFGAAPPPPALSPHSPPTAAEDALPIAETSPLALSSNSPLPNFPQVPLVYAAGLAIALAITALAAWILHRIDRTLHTTLEAESLGAPILGTVAEIRTSTQQSRHHLWQTIGKPAVAAALFVLVATAAVLCYKHLADPGFGQSARAGGASSSFVYCGTSEYGP
jgi:hypothetical protein